MKKILLLLSFWVWIPDWINACNVCEKQQPELLRGITHGTGPESGWDWVIVSIISVITVFIFILSLRMLLRSGENHRGHIKYSIFQPSNP